MQRMHRSGATAPSQRLPAAPPPCPAVGSGAAGPRVVLVDDDARLRAVVRTLLEDDGLEVVGEAADGRAALAMVPAVAAAGPVVVITDVRMPGPINGIEVTRLLVERCRDVQVLVFTGFPEPGIEQAARAAGATGVLVKGVRAEELVKAVWAAWAELPVG